MQGSLSEDNADPQSDPWHRPVRHLGEVEGRLRMPEPGDHGDLAKKGKRDSVVFLVFRVVFPVCDCLLVALITGERAARRSLPLIRPLGRE